MNVVRLNTAHMEVEELEGIVQTARILLEKGDLQSDDLVVLLSKNRPEIRRNNLCCIATLGELLG